MQPIIDLKIVFCFIVKDGGAYLYTNINKIISLGKHFKSFNVRYVENNSQDKTRNILNIFQSDHFSGAQITLNDHMSSTQLCDPGEKWNCSKRTRRLAFLRQMVLDDALKCGDTDIIVMLDMDFVDFDKFTFLLMVEELNQNVNIDGIFGMSVHSDDKNVMYDTGAVVPKSCLLPIIHKIPLVKVKSAFSGFGVYRTSVILKHNVKYDLKCDNIEHIAFNYRIKNLYVFTKFQPVYKGTINIVDKIFHRFDTSLLLTYFVVICCFILCMGLIVRRKKKTDLKSK